MAATRHTALRRWTLVLGVIVAGCDANSLRTVAGALAQVPEQKQYDEIVAVIDTEPSPAGRRWMRVRLDMLISIDTYISRRSTIVTDSAGNSPLVNLHRIATTPRAAGLSNRDVLNHTLVLMVLPELGTQGLNKRTCGAATVQYILAKSRPEEFAGLIAGLTSKAQQFRMSNGTVLEAAPDSIADPTGDNRLATERVVQSTFMNQANLLFDYDNANDTGSGTGSGRWSTSWGNGGVYPTRLASLLEDLTGKPYSSTSTLVSGEADQIDQVILPKVKAGHLVPVAVNWTKDSGTTLTGHFVTVTQVSETNGKVTLRMYNPWGTIDTLNEGPARTLVADRDPVSGELLQIGSFEWSREELQRRLQAVVSMQ